MDTAVRETTVYRMTAWIANKKLQNSIYFSDRNSAKSLANSLVKRFLHGPV